MRTASNADINITYPDNTVFSGNNNFVKVHKELASGMTHVVVEMVYKSKTYSSKYLLYGTSTDLNCEINLKNFFEVIFSNSQTEVFNTFGVSQSFSIKAVTTGGTTLSTISISFSNIILGKFKPFDKISNDYLVSGEYFETENSQDKFYFIYLGETKHVYVADVTGIVMDCGVQQGIYKIDLSGFVGDLKIVVGNIASTFDETFDFTFYDLSEIKVLNLKYVKECEDKIVVRFLNRFGMWRILGFKKHLSLQSSSEQIDLEDNTSEYADTFYQINKKRKFELTAAYEAADKETQAEISELFNSNFISWNNQNAWTPCKVEGNIELKRKPTLENVTVKFILQDEV